MAVKFPPGPAPSLLNSLVYRLGRDPLVFFTELARTYGDLAHCHVGGEHVFFVNSPPAIRDVLVTHHRAFAKGRGLERSKRLLGEGLLTSEGALHARQRRLIQPAFHRDRIAAYGGVMVSYAEGMRRAWADGMTLDVAGEMTRLTLAVVGKTLFGTDVESETEEVRAAMTGMLESFWLQMMVPFARLLDVLPIPSLRRSRAARARLDAIIYRMIAERRARGGDRGDLLSMLIAAQDEEATGGMSDKQVRDESMTIFLAGHETTANALTWTWYLISQATEVEARLHEEIDRVLQGRLPTFDDIPSLPYVEQVVTESMRLYPPAWVIARRAIENYPIDGYVAPARAILVMSPWVVHHDARYYDDPLRFVPERWTPEFRCALPRFAYFPFGGGPRQCIGEPFAWMELVLIVATIAQRWRLRLVPGHPVVPQPLITLRARHGMRMTLSARG